MSDLRQKNIEWNIHPKPNGNYSYEAAHLAVLMDLRDELQTLNGLLRCPNFIAIPRKLDRIARNTTKRPRRTPRKRR